MITASSYNASQHTRSLIHDEISPVTEIEPNTPTQDRNPKLALTFIFITALLDSIGFGIILPVIPQLIMDVSGRSLAQAAELGGWLMFSFAAMQFLFAPLLGGLSDRFGRRPVLLISLGVMGLNYILMGIAETVAVLFIGRIISGIGASTMSTCNAYIADTVSEQERAQSFGLMGAAFGMGFVLGPVIGGFLGEFGPRVPFFSAAALCFINMTFGILVLRESLPPEHRRPLKLQRANPFGTMTQLAAKPMIIGIVMVMFLMQLGHFVLPATWNFYTIERFDWSPRQIGYSLGFVGICMVLVQGYLIRLVIPVTGLRLAGILGLTFHIIAFLGYAFAMNPWVLYIALIPGALGALSGPPMQGIVTAEAARDQQGELQGGIASIVSLASIISPPLMTQTFGYFSSPSAFIYFPGAAFALAAALTVASLLLFIRITAKLKPVAG